MKIINAIFGGIVVIAWAILLGYVANHISEGNKAIEFCGVVAGSSIGAFLAWGIELLTSELKARKNIKK